MTKRYDVVDEHYTKLFRLRDALREAVEDHYASGDYIALGIAAQDAMRAYEKVEC